MTRKNLLMMAVLVALTGAGAAFAADQAAEAGKTGAPHARLDANGDGFVDKAEAAKFPGLAGKFDALDKNKDGKLSKDELPFRKGMRGMGPRRFGPDGEGFPLAKFDTDKDGRISRAEAKAADDARFAERFDRDDANRDGFIDKADFELRIQQRQDEAFAKADANKDGVLSKAEFEAMRPEGPRFGGHGPGFGPHDGRMPPPPPEDDAAPAQK